MMYKYIIVQAGGRGSRLGYITDNKPKALLPIKNKPMIFHLFNSSPESKFIIIGDYKKDVLERYLNAFAEDFDFEVVDGSGGKGTCSGLKKAIDRIPDDTPFMLTWCDLVFSEGFKYPENDQLNHIGISHSFPCRWQYKDGCFEERKSNENGVAGFFTFKNKSVIQAVPDSGEFVRWLSESMVQFEPFDVSSANEYGLLEDYQNIPAEKCRPFNRLVIEGDKLYKIPVNEQGRELAEKEKDWYKAVIDCGFKGLPKIYSFDPFCMEKIEGHNIYEYQDLKIENKQIILREIIQCLKNIHNLGSCEADYDSFVNAYITKTMQRLEKVRELVPFADKETIVINGKTCRNVFFVEKNLEKAVMEYLPDKFVFIHGDCTFSNMLLKNDETPVLIDPRGYFGNTRLYGDPAYDWVKLYYSLRSNYDQFNLKRFKLKINEESVALDIESNHWEELVPLFFELLNGEVTRKQMDLFLAITWLSLTTYAWEDYDSICGAFYNGLVYLEEAMSEDE